MAMDYLRPYYVRASGHASEPIEAWSGYPLQFAGQRRFGWQDEMAAELRDALAGLAVSPDDVLSGTYLSTDESRCDVENRLFTNPGTSIFPKAIRAIRFERGLGPPPEPPTPVSSVDGQLHYYRYCLGGMWQWWEPAPLCRSAVSFSPYAIEDLDKNRRGITQRYGEPDVSVSRHVYVARTACAEIRCSGGWSPSCISGLYVWLPGP